MVDKNLTTPHDRFFRSMMSEPKVIREFFEKNLPANIRAVIDFDTIQPQKDSFISDKLKLQIADVLYSAEFDGQLGYLYLLIEHQSTPEELMPFRVLQYMVSIMDHHLTKTGKNRLPVVYPMIFYNGWKPYNYSTNLFDLFGDKKELAEDILWKPCQLIDLSKIPDDKLKDYLFYGVVAYVMKHIYEKDLLPVLKNIVNDLKLIENQCGWSYISKVLTYILEAGEEIDKKDFVDTVKTGLSSITEDKIMTLAEQFRQEGRQEGYQKGQLDGMAQGIEKGIEKGKLEVAMKLFGQGMTVDQIASVTELPKQEITELKTRTTN